MKSRRWLRLGLLLGCFAVALLLYASGAGEYLEAERFGAVLRDLGLWGPVLYVLLFSLLEPFGVLAIVFVVPGSLVWDWGLLFLLSWLGAIGAGIVGFTFARTVGRDWVSRHMPERLHRYDERLATRGLHTVILVRLLFFLAPPAHWALGLSRVHFGPFVLGTAIGFLPGIALFTWAGKSVVDLMAGQPVWLWLVVIAVLALLPIAYRWRERRKRVVSQAG